MKPTAGIVARSLIFNGYFYIATLAYCLAGAVVRKVAPHRTEGVAKAWVRNVLAAAKLICGITLKLSGAEHLPKNGPALLASQHQSVYDTLIWMVLLDHATYVVKQELVRLPLFGPMLTGAGMIGVDRDAGASALKGMMRDASRATDAGRQIVIFPEGTRVRPGVHVKLKPGIAALATRLRLPVIPVATNSGSVWGRYSAWRYPVPIHVVVCPPLEPGTPRALLLNQIADSWRRAEQSFPQAVYNSVDEPAVSTGE